MNAPLVEAPIVNAMSIDVEDWFQVSALAPYVPRDSWDSIPCRVERNVDRILDLLERRGARATFFTLGWIAERHPGVVKRIVAGGHELASHGYGHRRASEQTETEFRADVTRAKQILEDLGGVAVRGYRAPSFSIGAANFWALDVLAETGHVYSSSVYPVRHDHYGSPDAPRHPWRPRGDAGLLEVPPTTLPMLGRNLPASGGGWFRLLPYGVSSWALRRVLSQDGRPAIFYFHPWEIDPGQPRQPGVSAKTRFRHYVNLHQMESKIDRLLADFRWDRVDRVFLAEAP